MISKKVESMWSHLHGLTVLAENGSYTAAARRLGVSKAAMSQHISELEKAVGVPLVRRTTRSMRLTEAGQQLVDETCGAFEQIATSFNSARDIAGEPGGLIRLTAPVALGRQQLVHRIAVFLLKNPSVRVEMEFSDRLSSLSIEGFDLAIRHTTSPPETHVAWPLCKTRSLLVASPAYLQRKGIPVRPESLTGHDCLHYPRGQESNVWSMEPRSGRGKSHGRVTVPTSGPFGANNSEALREASQAGLGIALLPDFSVQGAIGDGSLVEVLPNWRPVDTFADRIFAIRPYSLHVSRAVTLLVQHLRASFINGFPIQS
ncbi:LysR family transcriptional regulator [Polaromonas sp.]|uniref:LysR family transcriptional regulator n=1 Tax=Polaromonas sp. TaxID=1869339 RepID=UPI0035623946